MDTKKLREIGNSCTCFHLRRAARAVTQVFDEVLSPSGLRATQFTLLTALEQTGPVTVSHLAGLLGMDRTTLTRNLKPLEQQGWVEAVPGEDRRTRSLSTTSRGRAVLKKALPLWDVAQKRVVDQLGKKRWSGLMEHLDATASRVGSH